MQGLSSEDKALQTKIESYQEKVKKDCCAEDAWKHRGEKMKCQTCMYFVIKPTVHSVGPEGHIGRCRRHAPTMSGYPAVFQKDWCGDHKLDENKI